jgi:hypothetical protein
MLDGYMSSASCRKTGYPDIARGRVNQLLGCRPSASYAWGGIPVIRPGAADFTEHPVALLRLQARVESLLASRPIDRMRGGPALPPEVAGGEVYWRRTVVGEEMPLSKHLFP